MGIQLTQVTGPNGAGVVEMPTIGGRKALVPAVAAITPADVLALASNVGAAGNQAGVSAYGGDYLVRAFATSWNGASARLQFLDADGATWSDLAKLDGTVLTPFSANGSLPIGLGANAGLRLMVTGTPTGLYVTASRMP